MGLVPRYPLQKQGLGGEGGGDEGLKVEGGFTFGRLQGGLKGASRGLQGGLEGDFTFGRLQGGLKGGFKGASRRLEGEGGFERLEGGFKEASRGLEGGFKGASPSEGFKGA